MIILRENCESGYRMDPESFETQILNPYQQWVDEIGLFKTHIEQNKITHRRLATEVDQLIGKREKLFTSIGGKNDEIEKWDWLAMKAPLEKQRAWYEQIKLLAEDTSLEEKLSTYYWRSEFDFWTDDQQATKWITKAEETSGQIYHILSKRKHEMKNILEMQKKQLSARKALGNIGIGIKKKSPEN